MPRARALILLAIIVLLGLGVLASISGRTTEVTQGEPVEAAHPSAERSADLVISPADAPVARLNGAELTVTVIGASDEAVVEVEPLAPPLEPLRASVSDGGVELAGLGPGLYLVRVAQEGVPVSEQEAQTVQLAEGRRTSVVLHAKVQAVVAGRVEDLQGHPVEAQVAITVFHQATKFEPPSEMKVSTDARGRFRVHTRAGSLVSLTAWADGFLSSNEVPTTAGDLKILLQLKRVPMLRGRVLRTDGAPVTSFSVHGMQIDDALGRFSVPFSPTQFHSTDGVKIRLMSFRVIADGLVPFERELDEPASDLELGDLVMGTGRRVRGRVVEADSGGPIEGARVTVGVSVFRVKTVSTRSDGEFELQDPKEGPVELQVEHPTWLTTRVQVPAGDATITVRMTPGATIRGTVGRSPEGLGSSVISAGGRLSYGAVNSDRSFALTGLAEGGYRLFVMDAPPSYLDNFRPAEVIDMAKLRSQGLEVNVKAGETTTVALP